MDRSMEGFCGCSDFVCPILILSSRTVLRSLSGYVFFVFTKEESKKECQENIKNKSTYTYSSLTEGA